MAVRGGPGGNRAGGTSGIHAALPTSGMAGQAD